jgi:pectinesterase
MSVPAVTRLSLMFFLVLGPVGKAVARDLIVSPGRHGEFHEIQAAVDALPREGGTVLVAPGTYRGRVSIGKAHVRLVGQGTRPEDVVIVAGESAATQGSIYASATIHVAGDDFRAANLTFANDWDRDPAHGSSQAVALAVSGDRAAFERVRVLGGQDTLYLSHAPGAMTRQYFRDCYVEGHVDFIFGNAQSFFDGCRIHGVDHHTVMYTAHSRNTRDEGSGFVFSRCTFTAGRAPGGVYFGRPWRPYATMVLLDSRVEPPMAPGGWREWKPGLTRDGGTVTYAEHGTRYLHGPPPRSRMRALSDDEARQWTLEAFFKGDIAWTRTDQESE